MFNSPLAKSKRTGRKRYKGKAFGKKASPIHGGACLFCGYFTSNDALLVEDDIRIDSLKRINRNCINLWVCAKHLDPLLTLRWADLICEITS